MSAGADVAGAGVAAGSSEHPGAARSHLRSAAWYVAFGVVVSVLAVKLLVLEPMRIGSDSMAPTLLSGDHVLIDKLRYRSETPRPGELAAFEDPRSDEVLLKRVVAVGGDTVAIEDGVLVVNGSPRSEAYVDPEATDSVYFGPITVPPASVFVLGDNRANSIDSRDFGAVGLDDLIGPVAARMWPPQRRDTPN